MPRRPGPRGLAAAAETGGVWKETASQTFQASEERLSGRIRTTAPPECRDGASAR